jgi:hypothetical protein
MHCHRKTSRSLLSSTRPPRLSSHQIRHFHRHRSPRAARCGSFVEGAQIAQGVGYEEIRWTRGFTWFGPPERNTLRPRVNGVVLVCLSVRLKSPSPVFGVCPDLL